MIPEDAVEAAARAGYGSSSYDKWATENAAVKNLMDSRMRKILEAAAPHMLAPLLTLADERDKVHGTIRGHITTHELRQALNTHDDTQGEK